MSTQPMQPETSRRALLRGLSAAPVALAAAAAPLAAVAAPGASLAFPDAELIRCAEQAADLARRAQRTADHYAALVEGCEATVEATGKPISAAIQAKLDAACSASGRNDARLKRRARSLALMPATTAEGLAAKASAYLTVKGAGWSVPVDWLDELATSIVHDAARMGGRA